MQLPVNQTLRERIAGLDRPAIGMWLCTGSPVVAEICAASGVDWLLIESEHAPNSLAALQTQLQVVAPYDVSAVVRLPSADPVGIKQVLDLGATTIIVPMIDTPEQAAAVAAAAQYPPRGIRGVGSALARSGRWGMLPGYLDRAAEHVSVFVQIESGEAVDNAAAIAATDGIDGVFIGPSDLAASMGRLGLQTSDEVRAAVHAAIAAVVATGKLVGVNAFAPDVAAEYVAAGVHFLGAGADVTVLGRGAQALSART